MGDSIRGAHFIMISVLGFLNRFFFWFSQAAPHFKQKSRPAQLEAQSGCEEHGRLEA